MSDPATKAKLAEAAYRQPQVTAAPSVIVLYTDMADTLETLDEIVRPGTPPERAPSVRGGSAAFRTADRGTARDVGAHQGFLALGFWLLAAEAHGYATSPMGGFEPEKVKLLGLPANARIPAIVAIGRAAEEARRTTARSLRAPRLTSPGADMNGRWQDATGRFRERPASGRATA